MKNFTFLIVFFAALSFKAQGQIDLTYPNTRAVFQRNNANVGTIHFGGNFNTELNRIEARLIPIMGGGVVDWKTVVENPKVGIYTGSIVANGGWYKLEVRGIVNNQPTGRVASIERVGIGEVFLISGQSNAQGYNNFGQDGAIDDRVNCIDNFYSLSENRHPFPTFSKLDAETKIAPTGNGAWCWGRLGDLLVQRFNVPVLFINTGWEGMDIAAWAESADGNRGVNPISNLQAPPGFPFNSMKNSLHQYINWLGVRSVLFHQGESDTYRMTSEQAYKEKLNYTIDKTRQSIQKNVSFVVARVSRNQFMNVYQPVINAQNTVINSKDNIFPGPNTDIVNSRRSDSLHFNAVGLRQVADLWNNALSDEFFAKSIPQLAAPALLPQTVCNSDNQVNPLKLTLPSNLINYRWSNGIENQAIEVNLGTYQGRASDNVGNTSFTPPISYNTSLIPAKPTVSIDGPTQFCEQTTITRLTSSYPTNNTWSTSANTAGINVASSGNFSVSYTNLYGCVVNSNPVGITVFPKPIAKITPSGPTNICSDEDLFLTSSSLEGNKWSTNETGQRIKIKESANVMLTVTSNFGCTTTTTPLGVVVRPEAKKPVVNVEGQREFCADKSANLVVQTPDSSSFAWNNGLTSAKIQVNKAGNYSVISTNKAGCSKKSDNVEIKVNPLPNKPVVTADGPTSLCNDRALRLSSDEQKRYIWSNGDSTKNINVFKSGNYNLKTVSDKGCISPESDLLKVSFFETPLRPVIQKSGTFTLEAEVPNESNLSSVAFNWVRDLAILNKNEKVIKANESGNYRVQAFQLYTVDNNKTLKCLSEESNDIYFEVDYTINYTVYPNPVQNRRVSVETIDDYKNTVVQFYDYYGNFVKSFEVPVFDNRKTFDLSDMSPGQYIMRISNSAFTATKKLFVE